MSEALTEEPFHMPPGGWTVDHLDALPESHVRHELTDGALTVSPSPSNLHQVFAAILMVRLQSLAPEPYVVTQGVEIRFSRQLTRISDLLVVRTDQLMKHWLAPTEVVVAVEIESPGSHIEDRVTKPALYAQYGIPHYWRVDFEFNRPEATIYEIGDGDRYRAGTPDSRIAVAEPFKVDLELPELMPRWAR